MISIKTSDCVSRKKAFNYLQVSSVLVTSISVDYVQRFFNKNATELILSSWIHNTITK